MNAARRLLSPLVFAAVLPLGGCIVPGLTYFVTPADPQTLSVTLRASATHAPCEITARSGAHLRHDCDYEIGGRTKPARVFLQDVGAVEPIVDPVILQLPKDASLPSGIFSYGPNATNGVLKVTELTGDVWADVTRKIVPEDNHKLFLVEFPTPTPPLDGRTYDFGFVFPLRNAVTPIRLKALFVAKVTHLGRTFYPPLFPCTTTFANTPAVNIFTSSTFTPADLAAVQAVNACSGSFYTFTPEPPATVDVIEYFHAGLDHYFVTGLASEQAVLDAGTTIRGWVRTGRKFKAFANAQLDTSPVCRYYLPPAHGDSHFYGRGAEECDQVAAYFRDFVLEAREFMYMVLPDRGHCPVGTTSVYRVFSNRVDANHRYMTDPAVRDEMIGKGWIAEGDGDDKVVMCAPT